MLPRPAVRIAVLVDTSTAWGRRLIHGVLSYARVHGPWDIWLEARGQSESLRLPSGWCGDGVIARVSSEAMARHLAERNVPVVNVSGIRVEGVNLPRVCTDNDRFAEVAVSHFFDRGIRTVAYVGLHSRAYSLDRQEAVERACRACNCRFEVFRHSTNERNTNRWEQERRRLSDWLQQLPKPTGVLAWGVRRGNDIIEEAMHRGIRVPEEIAVLGDDDELLCEAVQPPLSGVKVPSEQIGLEAAAILDKLVKGEQVARDDVKLAPTGVVCRASTDVLAIADQEVAEAIRLIRASASHPLAVSDVAETLAISRRSLERRFKEILNRTVGEEIARVHLEQAKLLLGTTEIPVPAVAAASGYGSPEYLATIIKRHTGMTPRQYRRLCRGK
ncbi:MAG: substrate-binding domain-containing protein [Lacipirellulaceae bacterium]